MVAKKIRARVAEVEPKPKLARPRKRALKPKPKRALKVALKLARPSKPVAVRKAAEVVKVVTPPAPYVKLPPVAKVVPVAKPVPKPPPPLKLALPPKPKPVPKRKKPVARAKLGLPVFVATPSVRDWGDWGPLNWLRNFLYAAVYYPVADSFKKIKEGLQNLLKAIWDFPATARNFIRSVEEGYKRWFEKARTEAERIASRIFRLLISPYRSILDWWSAHKTIILGFFREPLGYLRNWLVRLGDTVLRAIEITLRKPVGYLKARLLDLFDFLTNLWPQVKVFFVKTLLAWWGPITYWIGLFVRLSRDSKNYFLRFLRDPWGVFRSTLLSVLEGLGKMLYVLVLEFVDFVWRP